MVPNIRALLVFLLTLCHRVQATGDNVPPRTIEAVEGTSVRIPCPQFRRIQHPDRIRLVLWFKDNDTNPIKSFDGRGRARLAGLPADLRLRSPDLQLTPVTRRHSGRYRCRVDAEDDPSVVSWITLTVQDAPETPSLRIYNEYRDDVGDTEVHIVEGFALQLTCRVIEGGDQSWHIAWLVRRPAKQEQLLTSETVRRSAKQEQLLPSETVRRPAKQGQLLTSETVRRSAKQGQLLTSETVRRSADQEQLLASEDQEQLLASETDGGASSQQRLEHNVTRADDSAALVCRAQTVAGRQLSAEVALRVTYGPDSVSLQCAPNSTTAGQEVTCFCHVLPARPEYQVTWLWGAAVVSNGTQRLSPAGAPRQLTDMTSHRLPETTSHQLTRMTSRRDDGRQVTCQAMDPVSGQRRQAVTTLSILYAPELVLSGPSSDLEEGDDAHFSCFVQAVPPAQFTYWLHNDRQLVSSERVVAGPQLLIVRNLAPNNTGRYACFANNTLGRAFSNTLQLKLKHAPVCRSETIPRQHAALYRSTFVSCRVRAQPRPSAFQWVFHPAEGGETRTLHRSDHSDKGHSSVLRWTPTTAADYGRLLCQATNAMGRQQQPCRFDVIPPEAPDAVQNCTVSMSEAVINCTPGNDRGMTPWYTLWLYGPSGKPVANWTERLPHFTVPVNTLTAGEHTADVLAETPAGRSEPVQLRFWPHPSVRPHKDESRRFSINSWVLGGAIFALLAVVTLVIVSVHVRCHCTPSSVVGSCRSSPGRPELTRQRSYPTQQPIYAEVRRRRSSPRPQQPPLPPRLSSSDWEPQPPNQRSRSRSRAPQPADHSYRDRSRTPQPPDHRNRDRSRTPQANDQRLRDQSRTPQPRRRPGDRSLPVHRCRSLPVPPPSVALVRGRSLQPADTPGYNRRPTDASQTQALSQSSVDLRRVEPDPADDTIVQVHLQPPTPSSTVSSTSSTSTVDDQQGRDQQRPDTPTDMEPVTDSTAMGTSD